MKSSLKKWIAIVLSLFVLAAAVIAFVPPVNQAFVRRYDQVRLRLIYMLKPPESQVFTPGQSSTDNPQLAAIVNSTMTALAVQPTPTATLPPTATPTLAPNQPSPTPVPPTAVPTPIPASALIDSMPYIDQNYGYNNCAPANLAMALKFWGWTGTREDTAKALKPFDRDKNVMAYELSDYVNTQTNFRALNRLGGTPQLLKSLVAAGFPVIVERGVFLQDLSGRRSWMGHYQVVYGYDDAFKTFQVKDSFEQNGNKFVESYDAMLQGWRSFDYTFVVVYSAAQESALMNVLGAYADEASAARLAYDQATQEASQLPAGVDQFFALFNRGTSQASLQDYAGAAKSFDQAFQLYAKIPPDYSVRPWRILWYETGPYFAYYYTGRYQDVVNLADTTISAASEPFLEESFYWRAMAKVSLGDKPGALADLKKSLEYHPGFGPTVTEMQKLGSAQ